MKRKLSDIRPLGRYTNTTTGSSYNIKKGRDKKKGTDHIFYYNRNSRVFINDAEFCHNFKKYTNVAK